MKTLTLREMALKNKAESLIRLSLTGSYFDICPITSLFELADEDREEDTTDFKGLRATHCMDYRLMTPEMKQLLATTVMECLPKGLSADIKWSGSSKEGFIVKDVCYASVKNSSTEKLPVKNKEDTPMWWLPLSLISIGLGFITAVGICVYLHVGGSSL